MRSRRQKLVGAVCATALFAAGCSSSPTQHPPPSSAVPSPSSTPAVPGPTGLADLPNTPAGRAMRWVLQTEAAGSGPTLAQVDRHVAATFLTAVPASKLIAVFAQQRAAGTRQVGGYIGNAPTTGQASVTRPGGRRLVISLSTDAAGKITGLVLKAAPRLPSISTPAGLQQAATHLGVHAAALLGTAGRDGSCATRQAVGDQGAHPLGSMFKLYVLGAVIRAVRGGTLHWDTRLTVTQAVKSLPSGQLQDAPVGTTVTVSQAATLMISISDNTAADLLIGAVGQPALAAAVRAMGNTHPALLDPFLTTKQLFTLDYDAPALRARWAATDPGQADPATGTVTDPSPAAVNARRALLAQLPTGTPTVTAGDTRPGWLDGIEWYATAADICRAQATLHHMTRTSAGRPAAAILAKNPGVDVGTGWSYVAYKGGEDTGVLTGSWLLQPSHGPALVLVVQLATADPASLPDDFWYAAATSGAISHLPR